MSELYTTIKSIKKLYPCQESLDWFLAGCNGKFKDNERIPLSAALEIHSRKGYREKNIDPVVDFLYLYNRGIFPKREAKKVILTFLADLVEDVLPLFEKKYPDDNRPRASVDTLRGYLRGEKTLKQLRNAGAAADGERAVGATDAAYAVCAADTVYYAVCAAYAVADAAYDTEICVTYAADTVAYAVCAASNFDMKRKYLQKLKEILK